MSKDAIHLLSNHIRERQNELGPEEGFRFKAYFDGKKMLKADYGTRADEDKAAARSKKRKVERGKGKSKGKQKTNQTSAINHPPETSRNIHTFASYEPQIDPALLGGNVAARNNPAIPPATTTLDTENNNPAATRDLQPDGIDDGGYIGDAEMQLLIANGYSNAIPINGPSDGLPKYHVNTAALHFLQTLAVQNSLLTSTNQSALDSEGTETLQITKRKVDAIIPTRHSDRLSKGKEMKKVGTKKNKISQRNTDGAKDGDKPPAMRTRSQDKRKNRSGKK